MNAASSIGDALGLFTLIDAACYTYIALALWFTTYILALMLATLVFDTNSHVCLFFRFAGGGAHLAPEPCPICLESLQIQGSSYRFQRTLFTSCGHAFHQVCIAGWLRRATTCPVCRADLLAADSRPAYRWCVAANAHVDALTALYLGA
jgi:hypothetical protein